MRRVVIFAHFHPDGDIPPYTRRLIDFLQARAERFILVSTCLNMPAARSLPDTIEIITRDNVGHDFMSYKIGWRQLDRPSIYDEIIIANDNIYLANPSRLAKAIDRLESVDTDVWALTASQEHSFHLQSFFVAFRNTAIVHPTLGLFWENVDVLAEKAEIVRRYERGLSAALQKAGLKLVAAYLADSAAELRVMARRKAQGNFLRNWLLVGKMFLLPHSRCNPTHFLWDEVLKRHGIIKLELLKRNPRGIDLDQLHTYLLESVSRELGETRLAGKSDFM